ncbi:MAG: hypothetical protein ACOCVF_00845 [bacterium]
MIKLAIIVSILLIFIEIYRMIQLRKHWVDFIQQKTLNSLILDIIYALLSIILLFTQYWYIGTILIILTLSTTIYSMRYIVKNKEITPDLFWFLISDTTISLLSLFSIIYFGLTNLL